MPSRNTIREFVPEQYYHVYNRGVEKRVIFLDEQDYTVFLGLLKKYLVGENHNKNNRHNFTPLTGKIELLAYNLLPNHFHLLFYQIHQDAITQLMRRISTGYVMYFNKRYLRVGGLFQGKFKASHINADDYLHHISRYIHQNAENYEFWPYSSLSYYQGRKQAAWLNTAPILGLFNNNMSDYLEFVKDYEESKRELAHLKWQLADAADM